MFSMMGINWRHVIRPARLLLVFVATFGTLLAPLSMASAHVVYQEGYVYDSELNCTYGRSEISHGFGYDDDGYSRVDVKSFYALYTPNGLSYCSYKYDRPAEWMKAKWQLFVKNSAGKTSFCKESYWRYNASEMWHFWIQRDHSKLGNPPCGSGYYKTYGGAYVKRNMKWYGGWLTSTFHNPMFYWDYGGNGSSSVTGGGQTPAFPEPPPDVWEGPDGIIDLSLLPACFEVLGPDGESIRDSAGVPVCIPSEVLFSEEDEPVPSLYTSEPGDDVPPAPLPPLYRGQ